MRRYLWPLAASVVLVTLLFVGLLPTRTYLQQRAQMSATEQRLQDLSQKNEALKGRVEELQTDAEVERLAREQYNLVKPGEEAYAILPPAEVPPTTTTAPPPPPSRDDSDDSDASWWEKILP